MRLTLDWDEIPAAELVRRIRILRRDFPHKCISVEKSASGDGYHVIMYFMCRTFRRQFMLRKKYWDDKVRLAIDMKRHDIGVPAGILFTEKGGKNVREY